MRDRCRWFFSFERVKLPSFHFCLVILVQNVVVWSSISMAHRHLAAMQKEVVKEATRQNNDNIHGLKNRVELETNKNAVVSFV